MRIIEQVWQLTAFDWSTHELPEVSQNLNQEDDLGLANLFMGLEPIVDTNFFEAEGTAQHTVLTIEKGQDDQTYTRRDPINYQSDDVKIRHTPTIQETKTGPPTFINRAKSKEPMLSPSVKSKKRFRNSEASSSGVKPSQSQQQSSINMRDGEETEATQSTIRSPNTITNNEDDEEARKAAHEKPPQGP